MAAELIGILDSFIEVPKVALSHPNHQPDPSPTNYGPWMWNPIKQSHTQELDDDDSWEVRAFAEDTGNAMGTTWPPRSYTCTFCRREFRSAQALGGHMNVHRRDRARLHQSQSSNSLGSVIGNFPITSTSTTHPLVIGPNQDFMAGGGLCVVYQIPDRTDGGFIPGPVSSDGSFVDSHSTLLSIISSYNVPPNGSMRNYPCSPDSLDLSTLPPFPVHGQDNYLSHHSEVVTSSSGEITDTKIKNNKNKCNEFKEEQELDLELRLGQSQPPNLS